MTLAPLVALVWMIAGALNPQRPWDGARIAGFALGVVFLTLVFLARLQLGDSFFHRARGAEAGHYRHLFEGPPLRLRLRDSVHPGNRAIHPSLGTACRRSLPDSHAGGARPRRGARAYREVRGGIPALQEQVLVLSFPVVAPG